MTSLFEEADKGNPQRQRFNEGFDIGAKSHPSYPSKDNQRCQFFS